MKWRTALCCSTFLSIAYPLAANAELAEGESFRIFVADRFTYDDNLYRLADSEDIADQSSGLGATRDDYINRVSAGIEGALRLSRQEFGLTARIDDSQYQHSSDLDNTSGNARAHWDWRVGENLSGQIGSDYARFLAGFINSRFLEKDVLESSGGFWNATLAVGPHWRLKASARHAQTEHGAVARQFDNFAADSGGFGIQYETSSSNMFGWDYRYSQAEFDQTAMLNGLVFDRNYDEHSSGFRMRYALTQQMALEASAGYLRREYPEVDTRDLQRGSFSGSVWEATLQWRPTVKTSVGFSGWRKLRAYLDTETDYFIAKGGSISPLWEPTEKISVALELSLEDQDYLGSSVNLALVEPRNDRVRAAECSITYSPLRLLQLSLSGRWESRDSDRPELQYDARSASVGVRFTY